MTDTSNKTQQSCTVSDTPESNALHDKLDKELAFMCERDDLEAALVDMLNLARKLERERDEAIATRKASAGEWLDIIANADKRIARAKRERDEARFDLAFRRDLYKLQEFQLDELRKQLAEAVSSCNIWQAGHSKLVADRDEWKLLAVEQERDLKEASKALERAKSNKRVMKEQHKELNEELAVVRKQNAEQLTILQENGIAEYGN